MKKYVVLAKTIGQTPLEAITTWKKENPAYADVPVSYAGRLDPMASGLLLVLLGEECRRKGQYNSLDKEYEIEILLDIGSDTGDALGLVDSTDAHTQPTRRAMTRAVKHVLGSRTVPYPAFSSKTVAGKPLFQYALEGTLNTIEIPTHEERIYNITQVEAITLSSEELQQRMRDFLSKAPVSDDVSKVLGADFRIHDVRNSWQPMFFMDRSWTVLRMRVTCASGTYMRTLAQRIGTELGTSALCLSIARTKIGRYRAIASRCGFWSSLYR